MSWIDLGNPRPRDEIVRYVPYLWDDGEAKSLPIPRSFTEESFVEAVSRRRSRRSYKRLNIEALSELLWLSCHRQQLGDDGLGFPIERRPVASAGSIHPIHILLFDASDRLFRRYCPTNHALVVVEGTSALVDGLRHAVNQVIPMGHGLAFAFVAEPGKTFAKYEEASSLVWRDAGVLLGHLHLVAEALGLNYCPLGITGEPWVGELGKKGDLVGVGLALVGSPG